MKITENEIRELVREAIRNKLNGENKQINLNESSDFTARRQIVSAAASSAMSFENEIIKLLNLVPPDELNVTMQQQFLEVVNEMKNKMIEAVAKAVTDLARFPRTTDEKPPAK